MTSADSSGRAQAAAGLTFGLGAAALGVLSASEPLAGVAAYLVATAVAVVLWRRGTQPDGPGIASSSPGDLTLAGVGIASAVVFPGLAAADGLGYFSWGPVTTGVAISVAALYAVYGVVSVGWLTVNGA